MKTKTSSINPSHTNSFKFDEFYEDNYEIESK